MHGSRVSCRLCLLRNTDLLEIFIVASGLDRAERECDLTHRWQTGRSSVADPVIDPDLLPPGSRGRGDPEGHAFGARPAGTVKCLSRDEDVLFTFYDFPAEHWIHIRTTNPIESTFATVRHRTRQTKGCGSRLATLMMVFKLARQAEKHWRRINAYKLITKVIEGVKFVDGEIKEAA